MKKHIYIIIQILFIQLAFEQLAHAAEVTRVSGNQILITSEEKLKLDQTLYLKDPDSERTTGVAVIRKKSPHANTYTAEVIKGKARQGFIADSTGGREIASLDESDESGSSHFSRKKSSHRRPNQEMDEDNGDPFGYGRRSHRGSDIGDEEGYRNGSSRKGRGGSSGPSNSKKMRFGLGLGFVSSTLNVKTSALTANMKGNGFAARLYLILPFGPQFQGLGGLGIQPLQASGTNSLGNTSQVNIGYLAFEGMLRYIFSRRGTGFWLGGGGCFLSPSSKDSNILSSDSISTNYTLNVAGGFDIRAGKNIFMIKGDYGMLPSSSTSTTSSNGSQINIGLGYFF